MKDELKGPKVEKVSVAIVEMMVENEKSYYAYLLNLREDIMEESLYQVRDMDRIRKPEIELKRQP